MAHYIGQELEKRFGKRFGADTRAHWSHDPATHLIIFVHGFGGSPVKTWPQFPTLVTQKTPLPSFDYIFYGYDGVRMQANSSALAFASALDDFLADPAAIINQTIPSMSQRAPFSYQRILVVAHSLGAVVTRGALLHAHARRESGVSVPWLDHVRLALFAPAHHGAYTAKIAYSALTSEGWSLGGLLSFFSASQLPLLDDLQPGSTIITELKDRTKTLIDQYKAQGQPVPPFLRADAVVWALKDTVVVNSRFFEDDPEVPIDSGHLGVCKPDRPDHKALEVVWKLL